MHFDKWFLRMVGVATIIGASLQGWAVYRIENPKPSIQLIAKDGQATGKTGADPASGDAPVSTPPALWLVLLAPLAFGGMILSAAIIFSRRSHKTGLLIHYAHYGTSEKRYKDVTLEFRRFIKHDSIDIVLSTEFFGDPYPNEVKFFTVKYSFGAVTRIVSSPGEKRWILPVRWSYLVGQKNGSP
jgi:hypothetical protein